MYVACLTARAFARGAQARLIGRAAQRDTQQRLRRRVHSGGRHHGVPDHQVGAAMVLQVWCRRGCFYARLVFEYGAKRATRLALYEYLGRQVLRSTAGAS